MADRRGACRIRKRDSQYRRHRSLIGDVAYGLDRIHLREPTSFAARCLDLELSRQSRHDTRRTAFRNRYRLPSFQEQQVHADGRVARRHFLSLFLVHGPIMIAVASTLKALDVNLGFGGMSAVLLGSSILAAQLVFIIVERPVMRIRRALANAPRRSAKAIGAMIGDCRSVAAATRATCAGWSTGRDLRPARTGAADAGGASDDRSGDALERHRPRLYYRLLQRHSRETAGTAA